MAVVTPPSISALPAAPDPADRSTFNTRAYPWSAALPTMNTEVSAVAANVYVNAVDAETSATEAAAQLALTTTQAGNALTSANNALTSANNADISEANALASANSASSSATTATTKAGEANSSALSAAASEAAAAAIYDSFDDRYLGAKASAPTLDNDGNALITGALYFNTTTNYMYVRTSGATWQLLTLVTGVSSVNGQTGDVSVGGGSVTDFTSSGTYNVPVSASFIEVHAWGAGGGGGSGRRGAAGTLRTGGGGGGGGALVIRRFKVSELVFPVTVTIGAGGAGGVARTSDNAVGAIGSSGGNSTFGSYVTAYGGGGGTGGSTGADSGGGGGGTASAGGSPNGGAPLITASTNTTQQFGGGSGAASSTAGKNSVYGGGGGGNEDTTNGAAGYSMYSGGGGAGGAGIASGNTIIVTESAGGTNAAASANTSNQLAITGAAGAAYTGGQGGSTVVLNTSLAFTQVAFGNSKYVALSLVAGTGNYLISTSTNGTTGWDVQPLPTTTFIPTNHFYDGSKWVFYGSSQIYTTTDLVNFTLRTAPSISLTNIAFAGGLYVAVGAGGLISTSPDLITWTARTSGTGQSLWAVTHNGTKWIVVGNTGVTLTSTDAITWTLVTVAGTPNFLSIAANGVTLVAHSGASPFAHYSTDTGATWNAVATVLATGTSLTGNKGLIYAGGRFVCVSSSALYTSTDGNTWTTQTDGTADNYSGIAYDGTTYVVGSNTANGNVGISSTDAAAWTARTFTDGRTLASGAGGAGGIAAGGGGGAASLNGTNSGAGDAGGNGFIRVYSW